jgi:hypothetical protein
MINLRYNTTRNFAMNGSYRSFISFKTVKSRRPRRAGHVIRTGRRNDRFRILVEKLLGNKHLKDRAGVA